MMLMAFYAILCNNLKCDQVMLLSLNKKYDSANVNMVIRFDYKHFKVLVTDNDEKYFPKTKEIFKRRFFTKKISY